MVGTRMEHLKLAIYNAAKEGKLKQLQGFLASKSSSQVKALTSTKVEGSTPLITASREGHLEVVQYLIVKCHADMHQRGSVIFDGETIEDAPPLWCAAAAGHFSVVKCLVQHKADPNCTTQTNSTPLRAACFDGHLGIVKYLLEHKADIEIANRHEHTCLMIACYKGHTDIVKMLLEAGANVNRCSVKRNTALHDCAENGSVSIAKLLLQFGARTQKDGHGMTPLMTAAVAGHVQLTEYFSALPDTPLMERINAIELLGATFLDKRHDMTLAHQFWRKAIVLRNLHRPPCSDFTSNPVAAYGNIKEPQTIAELEESRSDPERCRIIALLIRERVLGPKHPDTSYYIRYRGAVYADSGDFEKCVKLWMYALDMQRTNLEPLYPMTLSSLLSFAELFSFMQQHRSHMSSSVPKANHNQIMEVLKRAAWELLLGHEMLLKNNNKDKDKSCILKSSPRRSSRAAGSSSNISSRNITPNNHPPIGSGASRSSRPYLTSPTSCCNLCEGSNQRVYRAMVIILHLTALSHNVLNDEELTPLKMKSSIHQRGFSLYQLRDVTDHCDRTLLHLASSSRACPLGRYPVTKFPSPAVVDILMGSGFDPNARDCDGKTAMHLAAETATEESPSALATLNQLLKGGGHIDTKDAKGKSVLDLIPEQAHYKINRVHHQSLQCLASCVIMRYQIPYKHVAPQMLHQFIQQH
uniref:protein fem-1 homolog CG6966-like n=1 Tax=Ciona intestinalis TaxID=7719 RepID=UPI00006A328D|nr:protein fem-1 homolog CG6966-like [Ciona intestinalis]|eukprot:XP_002121288.1 protein fem-1 homolog CG6966-like [Ciona intestinalis]